MANEKRLIDANALIEHLERCMASSKGLFSSVCVAIKCYVEQMPTVDAHTNEQVANIVEKVKQLEISNQELETEYAWLKSCLNCKIRKECPRHCGKVVHDCDHWEYGDNAVEVVHSFWDDSGRYVFPSGRKAICCDICKCALSVGEYNRFKWNYCPVCGAKWMVV